MSRMTDRISYLQGLAEGMKLNPEKDSHKLILGILDVLGEVGESFEALAELLGVKPRVTRQFGDALFYSIARAGGCSRLVAWLYYAGIRIGYPIVRPFICAAIVALLAGGCAGCIGQGDDGTFVDPGDFVPPTWEQNQ